MDYTADWCLNCKTNEKAFIETEAVRAALVDMDILPMVADWTNEDEDITKWLEAGSHWHPRIRRVLPERRVRFASRGHHRKDDFGLWLGQHQVSQGELPFYGRSLRGQLSN